LTSTDPQSSLIPESPLPPKRLCVESPQVESSLPRLVTTEMANVSQMDEESVARTGNAFEGNENSFLTVNRTTDCIIM